jgi:hypothetical protein
MVEVTVEEASQVPWQGDRKMPVILSKPASC